MRWPGIAISVVLLIFGTAGLVVGTTGSFSGSDHDHSYKVYLRAPSGRAKPWPPTPIRNGRSRALGLWELIKMSRCYELSILRERSAARATVTGWLSTIMIRPVRVLGSRATPSWMNSERRS